MTNTDRKEQIKYFTVFHAGLCWIIMKGDSRKEQIIRITLEIIGESGVQGLTTARIAERAGISEAAIYRHFQNKDSILSDTVDAIGLRIMYTMRSIDEEDLQSIQKLERIFKRHLEHIQNNRGVPRIIYTSEVHFSELLRLKLYTIIENYLNVVTDIIARGKKCGEIKKEINSRIEAKRFLSMIQFTAFRFSLSDFDDSTIREGLDLWRAFLHSIQVA
jgi:AcrR family transcriptional regulator